MRLFSVVILAGLGLASAYTAAHPDRVFDFYDGMYPSDPYKREALEICFEHDHEFNRADFGAREACYHRVLAGPNPIPNPRELTPPRSGEPNFIDLYRTAGQGHIPQGDVRATQQSDRYLRQR